MMWRTPIDNQTARALMPPMNSGNRTDTDEPEQLPEPRTPASLDAGGELEPIPEHPWTDVDTGGTHVGLEWFSENVYDVMQRVAKEGNADTQDDGEVQESARRLAREHADKTLEAWCSEGQLIKASMGLGDEVHVVWRVATGGGRGTPL